MVDVLEFANQRGLDRADQDSSLIRASLFAIVNSSSDYGHFI